MAQLIIEIPGVTEEDVFSWVNRHGLGLFKSSEQGECLLLSLTNTILAKVNKADDSTAVLASVTKITQSYLNDNVVFRYRETGFLEDTITK